MDRWLGGNWLAECLHGMRAPDATPRSGLESWFVRPDEVEALAAISILHCRTPSLDDFVKWLRRYPAPHFTWKIERDF